MNWMDSQNYMIHFYALCALFFKHGILPDEERCYFLWKDGKILRNNPDCNAYCPYIKAVKITPMMVLENLDDLKRKKKISNAEWQRFRSIVLNGIKRSKELYG